MPLQRRYNSKFVLGRNSCKNRCRLCPQGELILIHLLQHTPSYHFTPACHTKLAGNSKCGCRMVSGNKKRTDSSTPAPAHGRSRFRTGRVYHCGKPEKSHSRSALSYPLIPPFSKSKNTHCPPGKSISNHQKLPAHRRIESGGSVS